MNRKALILAVMTTAVAVVLTAKHLRRHETAPPAVVQRESSGTPALYLFLDDRDHDAGCERVYSAFDQARAGLPSGFEARRVDAEKESALAKRLGVRMLPTILLVGRDGTVAGRIEGEGEDAEKKFRELVAHLLRGG